MIIGVFHAPVRAMHWIMAGIGRCRFWTAMALCLVIESTIPARAAEVSFVVLHAGGKSYTNAVVTLPAGGKIGKTLVINHATGMASIKVADLDDGARVRLGLPPLQPKPASTAKPSSSSSAASANGSAPSSAPTPVGISNPGLRKILDLVRGAGDRIQEGFQVSWFEWVVLSAIFVVYLMGCKACKDLCRRAGYPSSIAVWLPIWKRLALFKAVGVSRVWFVIGMFIPFVGFWAYVVCCRRLCDTFGRSKWLVWAMIFLPTTPFAFMALAESSKEDDQEPALRETKPRAISVEGIIAGDLPLRELRKGYPNVVMGLIDYGKAMERLYDPYRFIGCEICKTKTTAEIHGYQWQAAVRPGYSFGFVDFIFFLLGFVGLKFRQTPVEFETAHYLCPSCVGKTKTSRTLAVPVKFLALGIFQLSLGVTVAGLVGLAWTFNSKEELDMGMLWISVFGTAGVVAGWIGQKVARNLRIPPPMRTIARRPFVLSNVRVLSTASERAKMLEASEQEEFSAA